MKGTLTAALVVAALGLSASAAAPTTAPRRTAPDAGVADAGADDSSKAQAKRRADDAAAREAELAALREQVASLRERTSVLEDRLARADSTTEQLGQLVDEVKALRAQVADTEAARQTERQQAAQRAAETNAAIEGLMRAASQLSTGATDISRQLDRAQAVVTSPQAAYDLRAARAALENDDLMRARLFLYLAIIDAQQSR